MTLRCLDGLRVGAVACQSRPVKSWPSGFAGLGIFGTVDPRANGLLLRASERCPALTSRRLSVGHETHAYDEDDDAGKDHYGPPKVVDLPNDHREEGSDREEESEQQKPPAPCVPPCRRP